MLKVHVIRQIFINVKCTEIMKLRHYLTPLYNLTSKLTYEN